MPNRCTPFYKRSNKPPYLDWILIGFNTIYWLTPNRMDIIHSKPKGTLMILKHVHKIKKSLY